MSFAILDAVMRTYPARPVLDAREWPYSRAELEQRIDEVMRLIQTMHKPTPLRYWPTMTGRVIRIPSMKPIIHNGRKP